MVFFTTIDGGIYGINAIVLVDQKALILAGKLSVTPAETGNAFLYKVNAISNRPKALSILKVKGIKYHVLTDKSGQITHVSQLPNTVEVE